ncbi:hypothetical protein RQP46_007053 [Phenoliferia psychrophenolica]
MSDPAPRPVGSTSIPVIDAPTHHDLVPPPVPRPAEVAARARSQAPPSRPTRVPFFASAAQPEIVRANQKDLYYLGQLTERFEDVSRSLLGTRWLQTWSKELSQGSRLAYFGLTTLLGSQTLGEEYCDIMQYSVKSRKPPTARRRALLLSLHILLPYIISKAYSNARRALVARNEAAEQKRLAEASLDSLFASAPPPPRKKSFAARMLDSLAAISADLPTFETITEDYLRSVHLAVFYLWGRYYNLSKRAAGIRFISTQASRAAAAQPTGGASPPSSYEVLGVLMVVQLGVRTLLALRKRRAAAEALKEEGAATFAEKPAESGRKKTFTVDGQPLSALVFDPDDPEQASPYPEEEEVTIYVVFGLGWYNGLHRGLGGGRGRHGGGGGPGGGAPPGGADLDRFESPPIWLGADSLAAAAAEAVEEKPLTALGKEADNVYKLGGLDRRAYQQELESFIKTHFPRADSDDSDPDSLINAMRAYFPEPGTKDRALPAVPERLWQTSATHGQYRDKEPATSSFLNMHRDLNVTFHDDSAANAWVTSRFAMEKPEVPNAAARMPTGVVKAWERLSTPAVLRSDTWRYLVLAVEGGVYADSDVHCLRPISTWGDDPSWDGNRPSDYRPPSLIVGIEADVGNRHDWHSWWPRPLQFSQWTIASARGHPVLIDTLRRVVEMALAPLPTPLPSVMERTGPGPFTDAVLRYVRIGWGKTWADLKDLGQDGWRAHGRENPWGDIKILSITGFSPGVGHMGAEEIGHPAAMAKHEFAGSWRNQEGAEAR